MEIAKACHNSEIDFIKKLLKNKWDIDQRFNDERTCLMLAAYAGKVDLVKFLLSNHAAVNKVDDIGATALLFAASVGNTDIVLLLLASGADVNLATTGKNMDGISPVYAAAMNNYAETLNVLLKYGGDVNQRAHSIMGYFLESTPLMQASFNGFEDIVEILVEKGSDLNARDKSGNYALSYAVMNNHEKITEKLVKAGAKDYFNDEILESVKNGNVKRFHYLIKMYKNASDINGNTAIMYSVYYQRKQFLKELVSSGAEVNRAAKNGFTALMVAARIGDAEAFNLLLKSGADINVKTPEGMTVHKVARIYRHLNILKK